MGQLLEKPIVEKSTQSGEGPGGIRYGFSAMQGWRVEMEDAHVLLPEIATGRYVGCSFFTVFDGHAGDATSKFASQNLWSCFENKLNETLQPVTNNDKDHTNWSVKSMSEALKAAFFELDVMLRDLPAVRSGYDKSGSTAVSCFINNKYILLGNIGDSRGILVQDNHVALTTLDHKPYNERERSRIIAAGGMVVIQRVNGSLAVSRALGDFDYKGDSKLSATEQLVSAEADIFVHERDQSKDQFIALACDGIWDVMSNEDLCQYILARMRNTTDLGLICGDILDTCLSKGSRDNMSIMIIAFRACPQPGSVPALERNNDRKLEARVKGGL